MLEYTWKQASIDKKCEYYARFNNEAETEIQFSCFENLGGLKTVAGVPMKRYCIYVVNTWTGRWTGRRGKRYARRYESNWCYNYKTKAEANAKFAEIIKRIKSDKTLVEFEKVR